MPAASRRRTCSLALVEADLGASCTPKPGGCFHAVPACEALRRAPRLHERDQALRMEVGLQLGKHRDEQRLVALACLGARRSARARARWRSASQATTAAKNAGDRERHDLVDFHGQHSPVGSAAIDTSLPAPR